MRLIGSGAKVAPRAFVPAAPLTKTVPVPSLATTPMREAVRDVRRSKGAWPDAERVAHAAGEAEAV